MLLPTALRRSTGLLPTFGRTRGSSEDTMSARARRMGSEVCDSTKNALSRTDSEICNNWHTPRSLAASRMVRTDGADSASAISGIYQLDSTDIVAKDSIDMKNVESGLLFEVTDTVLHARLAKLEARDVERRSENKALCNVVANLQEAMEALRTEFSEFRDKFAREKRELRLAAAASAASAADVAGVSAALALKAFEANGCDVGIFPDITAERGPIEHANLFDKGGAAQKGNSLLHSVPCSTFSYTPAISKVVVEPKPLPEQLQVCESRTKREVPPLELTNFSHGSSPIHGDLVLASSARELESRADEKVCSQSNTSIQSGRAIVDCGESSPAQECDSSLYFAPCFPSSPISAVHKIGLEPQPLLDHTQRESTAANHRTPVQSLSLAPAPNIKAAPKISPMRAGHRSLASRSCRAHEMLISPRDAPVGSPQEIVECGASSQDEFHSLNKQSLSGDTSAPPPVTIPNKMEPGNRATIHDSHQFAVARRSCLGNADALDRQPSYIPLAR